MKREPRKLMKYSGLCRDICSGLFFILIISVAGLVPDLAMSQEEQVEEILITSTRGKRSFADLPTRVEVLGAEEINEKTNMKPGDIRMLLNESTGIYVQQTSATSFNSTIRMQGLDGRYTQLLRDGMPLYNGFSGGLSLLQPFVVLIQKFLLQFLLGEPEFHYVK